jgi:DNA polymerase-1
MNAIYTAGSPHEKIAFIGEAPGAEEERCGGAFVGKAGQLLTELLQHAGINRSQCYFDNVFQFRPPRSDVTPFLRVQDNKTRESPEYHESKENLRQRLANSNANVIVALGNVPLYALTGKTNVTKQRGSILESTLLPGRKVIPVIHPSAALREFLFRYYIVNDLTRVRKEAESPDIKILNRNLVLNPSMNDVEDFIARCRTLPRIAYDIEVKGMELSHLAIASESDFAMCIPFVNGLEDYWSPDQEAHIMCLVADLMQDTGVEKIGQNLSFDATFLYSKYNIVGTPLQDTMIAAGILYPDFPKGLDFLVAQYCDGEPYYKDDGKEWFKNPFGSEEIFRRYNAMDAAVLMEIFPSQEEELKKQGNYQAYLSQKALLHPLVYAGNKGIQMDVEAMAEESKQCAKNIDRLQAELNEVSGRELNPNSPKQLKEYFYIEKKQRAYTKNGNITVDDKALKRMSAKGLKEADIILELRKERKMQGTYYEMKLDPDNRLRCSFNPVGTAQGRISSSKTIRGTGANLQNQPWQMNALMKADPDHILVNQDLGQAENRVVAFVSGEHKMMKAFEEGIDIHTQTASMIYEVPPEDISKDQRDWGKRANHGLNYDLGYRSFALYYQITEKESKHIVERYHHIYKGVREWHATVREELSRNNKTLINCFNRKRTFLDRWGHDLFKVAYSYIPQSTIAELMNTYGVCFLYERQDLFPEVQFLNTIHDSIRYQIPLDVGTHRIVEIISRVKESLEHELEWRGKTFSIPVDTEMGFTFNKNTMIEWKASKVDGQTPESLAKELEAYVEKNAA